MFADLLKSLIAPAPAPLNDHDARLALSTLLVRLARADGSYARDEIARIDAIIAARYDLSPEATTDLRNQAEVLETEAPDTVRFTQAIKEAVPYEDRLGVIEALWQVALADGRREAEEDALIRMVTNFLGVRDMDSALARQRVEALEN